MEIHQIRTPLANSYVVNQGGRLLVVDVGARCHGYVLGFIEQELKLRAESVELIVCSHDDLDHLGGVRHLALACNAPFALPHASLSPRRKRLNDPSGWLLRLGTSAVEASRPRAWRMYLSPARRERIQRRPRTDVSLPRREVAKLRPSHRLKHGTRVPGFDQWEVLHTPGHTWDSCCYYHRASASLISGDMLLGSASKRQVVFPSILSNRAQIRRSARYLKSLEIENVYPGHGSSQHGNDVLEHL